MFFAATPCVTTTGWWWSRGSVTSRRVRALGGSRFRDVVIDGNRIEHCAVGIQLGPDVSNVVLGRNTFEDVAQPVVEAVPNRAQRVEVISISCLASE